MPRVKTFLVGFFAAVAVAAVMGQVQQPSRVTNLDIVTGLLDVTNTNTETTIYSLSIPGGTLGTARSLRLTVGGLLSTVTNTDSLTLRVKFGGTVMAISADSFTAPSSGPVELVSYITATGATNTQFVLTRYIRPTAATTIAGPTDLTNTTPLLKMTYTTGSIDTTTAQTLAVTAQWTGTFSTDHFSRYHAQVEWIQ